MSSESSALGKRRIDDVESPSPSAGGDQDPTQIISDSDVASATRVLEALCGDGGSQLESPRLARIHQLIRSISFGPKTRPSKKQKMSRSEKKAALRASSSSIPLETLVPLQQPDADANTEASKKNNRRCYLCRKGGNYERHPDAPALCAECNIFNSTHRNVMHDTAHVQTFAGQHALVTGGRANLGYAVALVLLRGGARRVVITTRFARHAATRYAREVDYAEWRHRLYVVEADFSKIAALAGPGREIIRACDGRLDILINNAAQTVPVPREERRLLVAGDTSSISLIDANAVEKVGGDWGLTSTTRQPDMNSWTAKFDEIDYMEIVDVFNINQLVPLILIRETFPLMKASAAMSGRPGHIINVSSKEGMFVTTRGMADTNGNHIHTNMAKAALNMITHTLGKHLKKDNILINSVDPGYLSHQHSRTHNGLDALKEDDVPLTWEDGAARVLHPILTETEVFGAFFKDYTTRDWMESADI